VSKLAILLEIAHFGHFERSERARIGPSGNPRIRKVPI